MISTRKLHVKDRLQISLLFLNEIKRINPLLFPMRPPESQKFCDDFRGNRS